MANETVTTETASTPTPRVDTCENIIRTTIAAAKAGQISNHVKTDEKESWEITTSLGKFRVENINRQSKTHREFNKTNLIEIKEDGAERTVNLGDWKKKLFYTLLYCLQEGKVFTKIKQDPEKIKKIAAAIKANPDAWTMTNDSIKGTIGENQIEVIRDRKSFASGKALYRVKLLENGVETLKGSQLMKLWK